MLNFRHQHPRKACLRPLVSIALLLLVATPCVATAARRPAFHNSKLPPTLAFSFLSQDATIWLARAASGTLTYFGLVAYLDRPRGELNVDSNALQIKPSQVQGAGLGLFCTRAMEKGIILGTYPGIVLPLEQNLNKLRQHPQCEAYVWRFGDSKTVIDPTNSSGDIDMVCKGGNPSTFGSIWLFENLPFWQGVATTLCRINEPPPGFSVNVATEEDWESKRVIFSLMRDVFEGEELFMDYGVTYDRSGYGPPPSSSS